MTEGELKARLEAIREHSYDDEKAHSLEDALFRDVLIYYSQGPLGDFAKLALTSLDIEFCRWCA